MAVAVQQLHRDDAGITWPEHLGVGGLSLLGSDTGSDHGSPDRPGAALARWLRTAAHDRAHPLVEKFPFREVVVHYQTVGRSAAAPGLVGQLRALHLRLPVPRSPEEWMLAEWLPSSFDQGYGDYDSYLAAPFLERLAGTGDRRGMDHALDILLVVLLADLLSTEAGALTANPASKRQRVRTHAVLQALTRAPMLAPAAPYAGPDADGVRSMLADDPEETKLAVLAHACARTVRDRMPAQARLAARVSMLPTTRLHDEHMFIRSVQVFELLYRQVYRCLLRTVDALRVGDHGTVCAELGVAAVRLEATSVLFRLLTTMPRDAFAIIRTYTDGRSAIQSRAYRQVEWICAPRPRDTSGGKIPYLDVPAPTVQEAYLAQAHLLPDGPAQAVAAALVRLDTAWRAMKRTHWGITLKIIGTVPGTGGTAGADYLRTTSGTPLFPLLRDRAGVAA